MKYRKLPVVIDAHRVPDPLIGETVGPLVAWLQEMGRDTEWRVAKFGVLIRTLEGEMLANPGDWIIRGVKGELYPCKPDIFAATYKQEEP